MEEINSRWEALVLRLNDQFDADMSLKGVLYLIGVQELNMGLSGFSREDKASVLHVAVCKLLSGYGFFKFEKIDADGWPHWKEIKPLRSLSPKEQELLMKRAILEYLN